MGVLGEPAELVEPPTWRALSLGLRWFANQAVMATLHDSTGEPTTLSTWHVFATEIRAAFKPLR